MSLSTYITIGLIICCNCLILITADTDNDKSNPAFVKHHLSTLPVAQAIQSLPRLLPDAFSAHLSQASIGINSADNVPTHGSIDGSNSLPISISKRRLTTACTTTDGSATNAIDCACGTIDCDESTGFFCLQQSYASKCSNQIINLGDLVSHFDTNWCDDKLTTGNHTLRRGRKCIMPAQIEVASGTSLVLSSENGNGAMAVLSGGNNNRLFKVLGEVVLVDLILEDGKTTSFGGAIYANGAGSTTHLIRSIIRKCEAELGGAVSAELGAILVLEDSTLESNKTPANKASGSGGGVYAITGAKIQIKGISSIKNNIATNGGGGFHLQNKDTSLEIIGDGTQVLIDGNTAQHGGGLYAISESKIILSSAASMNVTNNRATTRGGGFYLQDSGTRFDVINDETKLFIKSNTAQKNGGGIALASGAVVRITGPTVFQSNTAVDGNGGGIAYHDAGGTADGGSTCTKLSLDIFLDGNKNVNEFGYDKSGDDVKKLNIYTIPNSPLSSINQRDEITEPTNNKITSWCVPCGKYEFYTTTVLGDTYLPGDSTIKLSIARGNGKEDDEVLANVVDLAYGSGANRKVTTATTIHIPCVEQSVTLTQTHFENNHAGKNGGAIATPANYKNIFFGIENTTFSNNDAQGKGGALHVSGAPGDAELYVANILNSNFIGNKAKLGGGAISLELKAAMKMIGTNVKNNIAGEKGGALKLTDTETAAHISDATFIGNEAGLGGGAISVVSSASLQMFKTKASQNTVKDGDGGFLLAKGAAPILLSNVHIDASSAERSGGGGGIAVYSTRVALAQVNLKQCRAGTGGGGSLLLGGEAEVDLLECNLEDNQAESSGGHIQVVASKLKVHSKGSSLIWPKQEPVFPNSEHLEAIEATSISNGIASISGGSISCIASLAPSKGIFLGKGTKISRSSSNEGGGISANLCSLELSKTSISNATSLTGNGGAILVSTGSTLRIDDTTVLKDNTAVTGSGGAVSCEKCTTMTFNGRTNFVNNVANVGGGAVYSVSPINPVISTGSKFESSAAKQSNGGAIDAHNTNWTSIDNQFNKNIAMSGSGGAFSLFESHLRLDATTSCTSNTALKGGGGCILWEPYATNKQDTRWKQYEPTIENMQLLSNNNALYGANLATPAASLRIDNNIDTDSKKMITNEINILNPNYPKVDVLDWYNIIVRGKFAKNIGVIAKLHNSDAKLFGATIVETQEDGTGRVSFTELGLQGIPGSGPHELLFTSIINLNNVHIRYLISDTTLSPWISSCPENTFLDGTACSKCPAKSKSNSASTSIKDCICNKYLVFRDGACISPNWITPETCEMNEYLNNTSTDKYDWKCILCPVGGSCQGDITNIGIRPLFGWSRCPLPLQITFTKCKRPSSCLGAPNDKLEILSSNNTNLALVSNNESCAIGHIQNISLNLRCSRCAPNYAVPSGGSLGTCVSCEKQKGTIVLVVVAAFLAIIFFFVLIALKMRGKGRAKSEHSTIKRTLLTHLQMLAIVMSLSVPWPEAVRTLFAVVSSLTSVASHTSTVTCTSNNVNLSHAEVYYGMLVLSATLPVAVMAVTFVYWHFCAPVSKIFSCGRSVIRASICPNENPFKNATRGSHLSINAKGKVQRSTRDGWIVTNVLVLYIIIPSIVKAALQMFQSEMICGVEYWALDDTVEYKSPSHQIFINVVAVPSILFYGVILIMLAMLYIGMNADRQTNKKLMFRFGLLFSGFAPQYWWYEIIFFFRKLGLIYIVTFASSNEQQLHWALGVLVILLYLQEHMRPFDDPLADTAKIKSSNFLHRVESFSLIILITMVWSAVFFVLGCDDQNSFCSVLGVSVILINVVFVSVVGFMFAQGWSKKWRKRHRMKERFSSLSNAFKNTKREDVPVGSNREDNFKIMGNPLAQGLNKAEFVKERKRISRMYRGTKGVKAKDIEMRARTESVVSKEIKIGVEEE